MGQRSSEPCTAVPPLYTIGGGRYASLMSKRARPRPNLEWAGQPWNWNALRDLWGWMRDPARDIAFDRTWGVSTCGRVAPERSDVVGPNWVHGAEYQGSNAPALDQALRELAIPYEQFTFLDLGSGKGRALLVAAQFPFRQVIGIEYSRPLVEIARANVARVPSSAMRCRAVAVIHADAATYPVPDGPLLLYLFNPFARPVMRAVVDEVASAYARSPRRMIVVYATPVYAELWARLEFLTRIPSRHKWLAIYDSKRDE